MLIEAVRFFLEQACLNKPYCMLRKGEVPFEAERMLCDTIIETIPIASNVVNRMRNQLDLNGGYQLETFAKRMANYSVRIDDPSAIKACAHGFIFDNDFVEWRDVLIDLAIFEDCAQRLKVNFENLFLEIAKLGTVKRKETIVEGYLSRPPDMRGLKIMKVEASGPKHDLIYTRIPW